MPEYHLDYKGFAFATLLGKALGFRKRRKIKTRELQDIL